MKKLPTIGAVVLIAFWLAWLTSTLSGGLIELPTGRAQPTSAYRCPMHPWVNANKPSQCSLCGMNLVLSGEHRETHAQATAPTVLLPPGSVKAMAVRTAVVKVQPLIRTLRVAGTIGEDESLHGVICSPVEGRIDGLAVNCEGGQIHRLQPIASIFSRTLLDAAAEYKHALTAGEAGLDAATQRLQRYGLVREQIQAIPTRQPDDIHFGILSRLSGDIVKSYVNEGQYVKEGDKLFEVADLTRLWFVFMVSEQDLPWVHNGQGVKITSASLPGETLRGKVSFISPILDPATASASARVVLENKDGRIKNNLFAEGVLETDSDSVLAVPRSAVLWPGSAPRVYIAKTPGHYEQRTVKLGRVGDRDWEVLEGLQEGDEVVVSGNMLLDSQAQLESQDDRRPPQMVAR